MGGEKKEKHSFYSVFLFFAILPASVSYTHLDVYKRQVVSYYKRTVL